MLVPHGFFRKRTAGAGSGLIGFEVGLNDTSGSSGDGTPLAPSTYINVSNMTVSAGAIADLKDFDEVATGYGYSTTNVGPIAGGAIGDDASTIFTSQTSSYYQYTDHPDSNTITIDGLDDNDSFTLTAFHSITSGTASAREITVTAGGASGTQKTYTRGALNNTTVDILTGLVTDGSGNLIIKWAGDATGDRAVFSALRVEIEQVVQTIGLSFYTYGSETIDSTNHPGLTDIWNNELTTDADDTPPITLGAADLLNFAGDATGITLSSITETKVGAADGEFLNDNSMLFTDPDVPDDVHRRGTGWSVYEGGGHTKNAHYLLEGLDPLKTYNIYMMGAWQAYTTGQGLNFSAVGDNTVVSNTIDGFENTTDRCVALGITPDGSNEIAITTDAQTNPPNKSEWFFSVCGFIIEEKSNLPISPEAQDVLNRYSALTQTEHDAIVNLVNPFSASLGNNTWQYAEQIWSLNLNATDRLTPMKAGDDAVNNGCTFDINGATADGVDQDIDLKWNPTDDGVAWDVNENFIGLYIKEHAYVSGIDIIIGGQSGATAWIDINVSATAIIHYMQNSFPAQYTQGLADDTNYVFSINQQTGNQGYLWEDGSIVETDTQAAASGSTTADLSLFSRNDDGVRAFFTPATIPLVIIGSEGFDFAEWNTQVKIYLAALGMTIP